MSNLQIAKTFDDGESKEEREAYNMFKDPAIMGIRDSADQETLDRYAEIGEHMYGNMDYTGDDLEIMLNNRCKELILRINNGYHPSFLDESELQVLEENHPSFLDESELQVLEEKKGKEWYVTFGYTEEDLKEIVNVPKDLPILKPRAGQKKNKF
jgi:hypothetical protein